MFSYFVLTSLELSCLVLQGSQQNQQNREEFVDDKVSLVNASLVVAIVFIAAAFLQRVL